MTDQSAKAIIKESFDYETCKDISNSGVEGIAKSYSSQEQTIPFYDQYKQEIIDTIVESLGNESFNEMSDNSDDINEFKHECTHTFIQLVAMEKVDEIDNAEAEELGF